VRTAWASGSLVVMFPRTGLTEICAKSGTTGRQTLA
jgi:hypothetical protein